MEPGHEDREYELMYSFPLWRITASMEPGHEDREYRTRPASGAASRPASMEPGHEDREYWPSSLTVWPPNSLPQWSPVMKTGNTGAR